MKVEELKPNMRNVELLVKAVKLGEIREVTSRRDGSSHKVAEMQVGDDSGVVLLTLWDDKISEIKEGKSYSIKDSYTTLFQRNLRLNLGRHGTIEESTEEIEVNSENDVSAKEHEERFRRRPPRRRF